VRITADTNVLVRAITGDDAEQSPIAEAALAGADSIALPLPVLCELVWVLSQGYRAAAADIAAAIRRLIDSAPAVVDRPAVEAGLAMLGAGGDFADGVIAYEGSRLGADIFVSFDRKAVRLAGALGTHARLLA
jgi:predicted nucleic-acid-binding protein